MPNLEFFLLSRRGESTKFTDEKRFLYLLPDKISKTFVTLQQTHSDHPPLPGQSVEDVQLTVLLTRPQAAINKDRLRVGVIGRRVSLGTWWRGSRGKAVHRKPVVSV